MKIISIFLFVFLVLPQTSFGNDKIYVDYSKKIELPVTGVLLGFWFSGELFKDDLAPDQCRWCTKNSFDDGIRSGIVWSESNKNTAHHLSNFSLGAIPLLGLSALAFLDSKFEIPNSDKFSGFMNASLIVFEAAAISMALNQAVKLMVARERPYARSLADGGKDNYDSRLSFYSGHTSTAFVLAVSTATLLDMKGSKYAPYVWGANLLLASLVGYFRIAADKHYFTDVITGAIIGAAIGYLVPKYLHNKIDSYEPESKDNLTIIPWAYSTEKVYTIGFSIPL
jgi:membrane-associated phospholipid phosphatase